MRRAVMIAVMASMGCLTTTVLADVDDYDRPRATASILWYLLPAGLTFYVGYRLGHAKATADEAERRHNNTAIVLLLAAFAASCSGHYAEKWNREGYALGRRGDFRGAAKAYAEAVKLAPNVAKYHFNLGNMLSQTGHYAAAIDEYRTALRLDPTFHDASQNLEILTRYIASTNAQQQADFISDELRRPF